MMPDETHLHILKRLGVAGWNRWREENPQAGASFRRESLYALFSKPRRPGTKPRPLGKGVRANLAGIDLSRAELSGAFLESVSFAGADLSGANLEGANLTDANLMDAKLDGANLRDANLRRANLSGAKLRDANLMYAQLNGANLDGTDLTNCNIYGVSAWNIITSAQTVQSGLRIENYNEPSIRVDDLELAQFIYLLLNREKTRNLFNAMTSRGVLILGRFRDGGLQILEAIAEKLRNEHYLPIIFDFERPAGRNYTETVKTLVGLSRFVVADVSGPSVPQELQATVPHFKIPFVPIHERGKARSSMLADLLEYPWILKPPVQFDDSADLVKQIASRIIEPAERQCRERQAQLAELYSET